jgi:hypothetical protein
LGWGKFARPHCRRNSQIPGRRVTTAEEELESLRAIRFEPALLQHDAGHGERHLGAKPWPFNHRSRSEAIDKLHVLAVPHRTPDSLNVHATLSSPLLELGLLVGGDLPVLPTVSVVKAARNALFDNRAVGRPLGSNLSPVVEAPQRRRTLPRIEERCVPRYVFSEWGPRGDLAFELARLAVTVFTDPVPRNQAASEVLLGENVFVRQLEPGDRAVPAMRASGTHRRNGGSSVTIPAHAPPAPTPAATKGGLRHNMPVAKYKSSVEHALTELCRLIRRPPPAEPPRTVVSGQVPEDLQSEGFRSIALFPDEARKLEDVRALLTEDLRFEHLKELATKDATWRFVCLAHMQPKGDLVADFVAEHAREPIERTCFFPVEWLTVKSEVELYGIRLMPPEAVELPETQFGPDAKQTMTSIIAVGSRGTNYSKMSARARSAAERALRLLRATLREDNWVPNQQLRFRLADLVWFDDDAGGWASRPDGGWDLELDEQLLRRATSQEISMLPLVASNDIERRVDLALRWFERAQLAVDPMVELLYLFFALEAILGDKSEGLKAPALAVRRAMLGLLTTGGFTHPARTYALYDEVRSAAVHGEEPPAVNQKDVDSFAWDVRRAINEFLEYARAEGLTKRARVRKALDSDERCQSVVDALVKDDPKLWGTYAERRAGP